MATTSSTTKTKLDNRNLTRTRSLGRKPKSVSSSEHEANADGSDRKTIDKPLPNYLKPTISSRPDPVKLSRKNNALEDNQKLLRRRSFDRPPSSLPSPSTSSSHRSRNSSPARPRDRPAVPREKPVTATALRSTSFHGSSRGGLKGNSTVKSPPVASKGSPAVKKSGLSGSSSSKSKKEGSENVPKKPLSKEITPQSSPPAPAHEDEEENVKVETEEQASDHKEEPKEEDKDQVAQPDESGEEKETNPVDTSTEEDKGELITEDKTEEQIEEPKEPEITQENNTEDKAEVEKKVDDEENSDTVVIEMKEAENVEESKEVEEAEAEAEVKEEESESSKVKEETTETKARVEELPEEGTKKEVVRGKKESPTAYKDVIASKMHEKSKKNKVLALAGAFQTVIDYETASSK